MKLNKSVIIVAGGKGLRMGTLKPKQFLELNGVPILMRTLNAFYHADKSIKIILVLPRDQQKYWKELCIEYNFKVSHVIANGGISRFDSVKSGLTFVTNPKGVVAIHDGVRPLLSSNLINSCFEKALELKAVIPVLPLKDSIREIVKEGNISRNRANYCIVQTPQVFDTFLLKKAYDSADNNKFTDDAAVMEADGNKIYLTPGEENNLKITTKIDMVIASELLKKIE